jgi:predicted ribosomally synthesized peptide with nif11-like leader
MSMTDAVGFIERLESDEPFARDLGALKDDPNAVYENVKAAGFDAQPEEIREAFADRYGSELTPEQLDQIAAGTDIFPISGPYDPGGALGSSAVASAAAV